jgi:hypothetical protein
MPKLREWVFSPNTVSSWGADMHKTKPLLLMLGLISTTGWAEFFDARRGGIRSI